VLAGAIAVSEAFQFVRGGNALAGKRTTGISLWSPGRDFADLSSTSGPRITSLPSRLWVIGLGHLGQAVLWTLGLLPYERPSDTVFYLQDFDRITEANLSTSLLTVDDDVGLMKTRTMAAWCERRGFRAHMIERRFAGDLRVGGDDPRIAICVVDNAIARASIEEVGFDRVLEAGLGASGNEYLSFQVHAFPGLSRAREKWSGTGGMADHTVSGTPADPAHPKGAYRSLLESGEIDECGITMLAGKAVGASFVGAAVAAIVVSELFRMGISDDRYALLDGTLRSPNGIVGVQAARVPSYSPALTKLSQ
jgi:hypothetical protein